MVINMSYGAYWMYYQCPNCSKKVKYSLDQLSENADEFGTCPDCKIAGQLTGEGTKPPQSKDEYEEIF